jgi:group I intron endonuclease
MPYAVDFIGIYKIVNNVTGKCYVGQSQRLKKRIKEHFRLLKLKKHPNEHLQRSYNKYGKDVFEGHIEVICENTEDLDALEEAFLTKEAWFEEEVVYNIANFAKAPMRGKKHSEETRQKIKEGKAKSNFDYSNPIWRESLRRGQYERLFSDEVFVANLKYILDNPDMSYAQRGRHINKDTSATRKMFLKYKHLQGTL